MLIAPGKKFILKRKLFVLAICCLHAKFSGQGLFLAKNIKKINGTFLDSGIFTIVGNRSTIVGKEIKIVLFSDYQQ